MKIYSSALGKVEILDTNIRKRLAYGQYLINVEIHFEGNRTNLLVQTSDSQLFEAAYGRKNHSEIVLKEARLTIERAIKNYLKTI